MSRLSARCARSGSSSGTSKRRCAIGSRIAAWDLVLREIMPLTSFSYRGVEHGLKMSIAMANSGAMQIELIQQRNDVPSMYRDFLAAGHEGLQHWSSWPENYSEMVDRALTGGWKVGQQGDSERGKFVYFSQ